MRTGQGVANSRAAIARKAGAMVSASIMTLLLLLLLWPRLATAATSLAWEQTPTSTAADAAAHSEGVNDSFWTVANLNSEGFSINPATGSIDLTTLLTDCTCGQHSWSETDANNNPLYPRWVQYTGNDANWVDLAGTVTNTPDTATWALGSAIPADGAYTESELWIDADSDGDNKAEQPKVATTAGDGNTVYSSEFAYYFLRMKTGDYANMSPNHVTGRASYFNVDRAGTNANTGFIPVSINAQYFYELTSFGADKVWDESDDIAWTEMLVAINNLKKYDSAAQRWYLDDNGNGSYDAWSRGTSNANPAVAGETWISAVDPEADGPIVVGGYDITAELASIADDPDQIIPAYIDINANGVFDLYTEPFMDWNQNGKWDAHYGPEMSTGAVIHEWGCPLFGSSVRPTYEGAVATGQDSNWKINGNGIFKMHNSAASADSTDQMFNYAADMPFAASIAYGRTTANPLITYFLKPEYQSGTNIDSGPTGSTSVKLNIIPMSEGNNGNVSAGNAAGNADGLPGGLNNWVLHPWSFTLGAAENPTSTSVTTAQVATAAANSNLVAAGYDNTFAAKSSASNPITNYVWQPIWRQYYGAQYNANSEFTGNSTRTTASLYWNDPTLAQIFFAQSRSTYDDVKSPTDGLNVEAANRNLLAYESTGSAAGDTANTSIEARTSRALGETPLLVEDAAAYLLPRFDGAFPKIGGTAEGVSYIADVAQYFGANTDIGPSIQSVNLDYNEADNRITQARPAGGASTSLRSYWTFGYGTTITGSYAVAASSSYHMASVYGNTPTNTSTKEGGYTVTSPTNGSNNAVANPTGWLGDSSPTLEDGAYPFYQPLSININYTRAAGWQDATAVTGTSGVDMATMEASPAAKTALGHRSAGFANLNDDSAVTSTASSTSRYPITNTLYGLGNGSTTGISNSAAWLSNWRQYFTGGIVIGNLNAKSNAPYSTDTGNSATKKVDSTDLTEEPAVTIEPAAAVVSRYVVGFYTQDWIYMGSEARDPAAGLAMQVWNAGDSSGWTSSGSTTSTASYDNSLTSTDRLGVANSKAKASVYATYQNNWGYSGGWPDSYWSYLGDQRIMKSGTSDAKKGLTDPTDSFGRWSATTFNETTYAASLQPSDITYGQGNTLSVASSYQYPNLYYIGSVPSQSQASGNSNAASLSMGTAAGTAWNDVIWRRNWVYGYGLKYGGSATNPIMPPQVLASSASPTAQLPTAVEAFANLSYGGNLMYTQNSLAWYSRSLPTMWWRGPLGNSYDPDGQDKDGMIWMGGQSAADALIDAKSEYSQGTISSLTADIGEGTQNKYNYVNAYGNNSSLDTKQPNASALGYIAGYNIVNRTGNILSSSGMAAETGIPTATSFSALSYASSVVRDRQNYDASAETSVYYVADDIKLRYAYAAGREQEPVQHYFYPLSKNMYNYDHTDDDPSNDDLFSNYSINGYLNNPLTNQSASSSATKAVDYASKNVVAEDSEFSQMTNLRTGDLLPTTQVNIVGDASGEPGNGTVSVPVVAGTGNEYLAPDTTVALLKDEYGRDPADPYEDTQYWYSVKMKSVESPISSPYTGLTSAVSEMYTNDFTEDAAGQLNATNSRLTGNADDFTITGMSAGLNPLPSATQREQVFNTSAQKYYTAAADVRGLWVSEETGYRGTVAYTGLSVSGQPMDEELPFGNGATASNFVSLNTNPITGGIQEHDLYYFNSASAGNEGASGSGLSAYVANDFNYVRTGPRLRTVGQQLKMKSASTTEYQKYKPYAGRISEASNPNPLQDGQDSSTLQLYPHGNNTANNLANWEKGWQWDTSRSEQAVAVDAEEIAYFTAASGDTIKLDGGNHIQDGYHIINLGSTVTDDTLTSEAPGDNEPSKHVDLGSNTSNTDHDNTKWLYDGNGDGIVGLNESYADVDAAPQDTGNDNVYNTYTIPATIPTRPGYNFFGYRLIIVDTGYDMNRASTNYASGSQKSPAAYQYGPIADNPNTPAVNESYGAAYVQSPGDTQAKFVETGGGQIVVHPGDEILAVAQGRAYKKNTASSTDYTKWVYGEPVFDPVTWEFLGYRDANDGDGDGDTDEWLDYYEYDGVPYETPAWEVKLVPLWGPSVQYTDRNGGYTNSLPTDVVTDIDLDPYGTVDDLLPIDGNGLLASVVDNNGTTTGYNAGETYEGYRIPTDVPVRTDGAIFQHYRVYVDNMDYTDEAFKLITDVDGSAHKYMPGDTIYSDTILDQEYKPTWGEASDTIPGNVRLVAVWRMPVIYTDNENGTDDNGIDADNDPATNNISVHEASDVPGKDILVPSNLWDDEDPVGHKDYDDLTLPYYYPYRFHEYAVPATTANQNVYLEPRFDEVIDYLDPAAPDFGLNTSADYAAYYFFLDDPSTSFVENEHMWAPSYPRHEFKDFEWDHWFIRSGPAMVNLDKVTNTDPANTTLGADGQPDAYYDEGRVRISDTRGIIYVTAVWKYSVRYNQRYEDAYDNDGLDIYGNLILGADGNPDVSHLPPDEVADDDGDGTDDNHPANYGDDYIDDYVRFYTDYVYSGPGAGQGWYDALPDYAAFGPGYMILSTPSAVVSNETPQKAGAVFEYYTVSLGGIYGDEEVYELDQSIRHTIMAQDMLDHGITPDAVGVTDDGLTGAQKFYPGDLVPWDLFLQYKGRIILTPHWKSGSVLYDGNEASVGETPGSARYIPDHWPDDLLSDPAKAAAYAAYINVEGLTDIDPYLPDGVTPNPSYPANMNYIIGTNAFHSAVGVTFGIQWHDPKHRGTGVFADNINNPPSNPTDEPLTPFFQDGDWDETDAMDIPQLGAIDADHPNGAYSFLGWNTKRDGSGDWYYPAASKVDGSSQNPAILQKFIDDLPEGYALPVDDTRANMTTYALHYDPTDDITEYGVVFYAIWDPPMVQYHFNGGHTSSPVALNDGTTVLDLGKEQAATPVVGEYIIPADLRPGADTKMERAGYVFLGWNTKVDGSGDWYSDTKLEDGDFSAMFNVAKGTTAHLYAIWAKPADVYYHANGDGPGDAAETMYGGVYDDINISDIPVAPGDGFTGHEQVLEGHGYKVRPRDADSDGVPDVSVPQWPSSNNYTDGLYRNGHFVCWNLAADGTGLSFYPGDTYILRGSVEFYAQWENWVTYHGNAYLSDGTTEDSTLADMPDLSATDGHAVVAHGGDHTVLADEPTRDGYDFIGWNSAADGTGTWYYADNLLPGLIHDTDLYAQWSIHVHTVWFTDGYSTGYQLMDDTSAVHDKQTDIPHHGAAITPPTNPVRDGYIFIGWSHDPSYYSDVTEDLVIWALWKPEGSDDDDDDPPYVPPDIFGPDGIPFTGDDPLTLHMMAICLLFGLACLTLASRRSQPIPEYLGRHRGRHFRRW